MSTQEAFGRVLVNLSRDDSVGKHLVTTAPDVATSTNLAGFINRTGVFAPEEKRTRIHSSSGRKALRDNTSSSAFRR